MTIACIRQYRHYDLSRNGVASAFKSIISPVYLWGLEWMSGELIFTHVQANGDLFQVLLESPGALEIRWRVD